MRLFEKDEVIDIAMGIFDFIDFGKVKWKDMEFFGHPGFYFFHTREELMSKIQEYITKDKYDQYDICYIVNCLIKFMLNKYDSHTKVLFSNTKYLPIELKIENDEVYIINTSLKLKKFMSWRVLKINNILIKDLLEEIDEICCYSTGEYLRTREASILTDVNMIRTLPSIVSSNEKIDFLVSDGKNREVISFYIDELYDECMKIVPDNYSYEVIGKSVVIHYNSCRDIDKMNDLINKISSLDANYYIVDLRYNGGGDSSIIKPLIKFLKDKKIVVLINEYVFSSGRMALVELKKIGAYVVGTNISTSLNSFGNNPSEYIVDNTDLIVKRSSSYFLYDKNYNCRSFSKNDFEKYFKDKKYLLEPVMIRPDLEVVESVLDIVTNKDRQLEAAARYLEEKYNGKDSI